MERLPQISRQFPTNVAGLDLVRLVDVRDIQGLVSPYEVYATTKTALPQGWLVPNLDAVWIDIVCAPETANYNSVVQQSVHGPSYKHSLVLRMTHDHPDYGRLVHLLSKGRWMAMVQDGNDNVKLLGLPEQPLKLKQATLTTAGINGWTVELTNETLFPCFYLNSWDLDTIYGNPADYSFDFSTYFNA